MPGKCEGGRPQTAPPTATLPMLQDWDRLDAYDLHRLRGFRSSALKKSTSNQNILGILPWPAVIITGGLKRTIKTILVIDIKISHEL